MNPKVVFDGTLNCLVGTDFFLNPKLNLLIVFSGNQKYFLSRLDLRNKLYSLKTPNPIVQFCWCNRNGRIYTMADSSFRITVHDIENRGRVLHAFDFRKKVKCISWINSKKNRFFFDVKEIKRELPRLRKAPKSVEELDENEFDKTPLLIKHRNGVNIFCVSSDERLCMYFFSIFQVCNVPFKRYFKNFKNISILRHVVSNNLRVVSVIFNQQNKLRILTLNGSKLAKKRNELLLISLQFTNLSRIIMNIRKILQLLSKLWNAFIIKELVDKFVIPLYKHKFPEQFKDLKELNSPHKVKYMDMFRFFQNYFLNLLLFGKIDMSLVNLFTKNLTEEKLQKILITIDETKEKFYHLIKNHLENNILHCIHRFSLIQSALKWKERFGFFGLNEKEVTNIIESCQELFLRKVAVLDKICRFLKNFSTFVQFLRKINIEEFLSDKSNSSLMNYPMEFIPNTEVKLFLQEIVTLNKFGFTSMFDYFQKKVEKKKFLEMFAVVSKSISKTLKKIYITSISAKKNRIYEYKNFRNYQYFAFLYPKNKIGLLRINSGKDGKFEKEFVILNFKGIVIESFKFLQTNEIISILFLGKEKKDLQQLCRCYLNNIPFFSLEKGVSIDKMVKKKSNHHVEIQDFSVLVRFRKFQQFNSIQIENNNILLYSSMTNQVILYSLEDAEVHENLEGEEIFKDEKRKKDFNIITKSSVVCEDDKSDVKL